MYVRKYHSIFHPAIGKNAKIDRKTKNLYCFSIRYNTNSELKNGLIFRTHVQRTPENLFLGNIHLLSHHKNKGGEGGRGSVNGNV